MFKLQTIRKLQYQYYNSTGMHIDFSVLTLFMVFPLGIKVLLCVKPMGASNY